MRKPAIFLILLAIVATPELRAGGICATPGTEQFRYSWKLRGGLAWIAGGLRFPTRGTGELKTVYATNGSIDSQLRITDRGGDGFYLYHSLIDENNNNRTLQTYHGYSWGNKSHSEQTKFDYVKGQARIHEESAESIENRVKKLPSSELRDVLTGIHYLRTNAATLRAPMRTDIYSDGKLYPVVFKPAGRERIEIRNEKVTAHAYVIAAAPHALRKWPGAVKVWLSADERRIPLRIELQRNLATLRLDLDQAENCELP